MYNNIGQQLEGKQEIEDYEQKITLRLYVEKYLTSTIGRYFEIFSALGSFVSCLFYIICTYVEELYVYLLYIDFGILIVYIAEFLLRFFAAQHRF